MQKRHAFRFELLLIVLTYVLLACQAGTLVPSFFATATPTFTITPSPTATATSTPTQAFTPTIVPDMSLETQVDGSSLFIDNKAGFSVLIPSTWVAIPANVDDFTPYVKGISENNPQLEKAFSMLQKVDPNILKIMAMDTNMEHYVGSFIPNMTVATMKDPIGSKLPLKNVVQIMGDTIKSQFPGAKLLDSGIEQVNSDFSYGYNEWNTSINTQDDTAVKIFQKQVFFPIQDYFVIMTLSAPASKYDDVLAEFETIMETIQFLDRQSSTSG
ncbi:hypothetical protein ANAEL_02623 [Anaerolineales bacterium]|nr:hypothetical protein ANAEL_02623 [Anaerolineales bacterium]